MKLEDVIRRVWMLTAAGINEANLNLRISPSGRGEFKFANFQQNKWK